jgi:hypothetical protein
MRENPSCESELFLPRESVILNPYAPATGVEKRSTEILEKKVNYHFLNKDNSKGSVQMFLP